ncbi:MAG: type II toxin-antitoxin system Phd/YefM family antitoxin [Clostridiales bacterium]|nr:type II toxin-antitoxin system Phd/YefM family antitoxin [Clostridiales bacterium]
MRIIPIKELKNTAEISEMCRVSNEPIYITKNGYGDMVIMNIEVYNQIKTFNEIYKNIEISEKQIAEGRVKDAMESLNSLRSKYDL